jgi:predicted RNA-binding Zn-ribbon protein involved in translation (DUF1610 family)
MNEEKYIYECPECGWTGKTVSMTHDCDCGDDDNVIYSDFCCPNCGSFYYSIEEWKRLEKEVKDGI